MQVQPVSIHTKVSFGIGITILCLLVVAFLTWKLDKAEKEDITYLLIGIPIMLSWLLSLIGLSKIFRTRRERKSFRWYFGLVVNGSVLLTVIIALAINIAIIAKFFSLI
jgi:hypothetical protein